jgi:hypothetical protein
MPLKETTPSSTTPCNSPLSTFTIGGACEKAAIPKPAASSAAREHSRSLDALEAALPPFGSARMPHSFG